MYITESEFRRIVKFVLEKNVKDKKSFLFENYNYASKEILYEEILKEISIRHQLLPILLSIAPLIPNCSAKDIQNGKVPAPAVAMAQVIKNKIPTEHQPTVVGQIANKNCTKKLTYTIMSTYDVDTKDFNFNVGGQPKATWEEVCEEVPDAEKIVKIATNPEAMKQVVDDSGDTPVQEKIIKPQLEKDMDNGTCKVIDGEVFYTPFCYGGDVESASLEGALMPGEEPDFEDLNQQDSQQLNEFLEVLEEFIKSDEIDWKWNSELIKKHIRGADPSYKGLDMNKIEKLHSDWVKTKSNQKDIDDYINGPAQESFLKGIMKQSYNHKQKIKDLKSIGLR